MQPAHMLHPIPYCAIIKLYSWKERAYTIILTQKGPLEFTHSLIQQIFIKCLFSVRNHCARHQGHSSEIMGMFPVLCGLPETGHIIVK